MLRWSPGVVAVSWWSHSSLLVVVVLVVLVTVLVVGGLVMACMSKVLNTLAARKFRHELAGLPYTIQTRICSLRK